jgi:hypothetical protein
MINILEYFLPIGIFGSEYESQRLRECSSVLRKTKRAGGDSGEELKTSLISVIWLWMFGSYEPF